MTQYMLAQLQLKFGPANLQRLQEVMPLIRKLMEGEGIRLHDSMMTSVGRLYEVWDLWEIEDEEHLSRARPGTVRQPEHEVVQKELGEILVSEQVRFLKSLPFTGSNGGARGLD